MEPTTIIRQKLIIDGYNMLRGAADLEYGLTVNDIHIDPGRLAALIDRRVAQHRSDAVVTTTAISIHLGTATVFQDRYRHRRESERTRRWLRDRRVSVHQSPLIAKTGGGWREDGVDEAIGADLRRAQCSGDYDSVVLFTADRDLRAELSDCYSRYGRGAATARVTLARWDGQRGLCLPGTRLWTHWLTHEDFLTVTTYNTNPEVA